VVVLYNVCTICGVNVERRFGISKLKNFKNPFYVNGSHSPSGMQEDKDVSSSSH
jgi:hypothetical protein